MANAVAGDPVASGKLAVTDPDAGEAFRREILAKGGSEEAMVLFKAFRGREPKVDALLRHSGIGKAA